MIAPDPNNGLYHPQKESEIVELIAYAAQNKLQVRVRGAAQSAKGSVFTDGFPTAKGSNDHGNNINIELDQFRAISIDEATMQVTVGGGCNLGVDPYDPSGQSEQDSNNLFFQLNQKGLAIPNVPGAIHQTVAGFISTGSSGGSMQHSFDECILAIRIIDGTGKIQDFTKSADLDNPFYAVGVSMGLLGIITQVTLQCVPAFNIIGKESTTDVTDCEFNFFGTVTDARQTLESYVTNTEFSRTLWWPFKTLHRVISWRARTMATTDYNADTGTAQNFIPKPYKPIFPGLKILGQETTLPTEAIASTGFQLLATWPDWLDDILGSNAGADDIKSKIELIFPYVYPLLTNLYFPVNTATKPAQIFWDNWLGSLPMDKAEFSNNLFDLTYCEMWVPANLISSVVNIMQGFYDTGYSATGFYTVEILGAKKSNFWLSPAYAGDAIRINILYFNKSKVTPEEYFSQFWKLFDENPGNIKIKFRPHWGKTLPDVSSAQGPAYLRDIYPQWDKWMSLRDQMDPQQIFVNEYWRSHLDIK
jgi:hypothetical protein